MCILHFMELDNDVSWNYSVVYQEPLRTVNTHLASKQTVLTDAPTDNHGLGEAFSPTDLLSTSLAACVMTIMGIHVKSRSYKLLDVEAHVQKKMAAHPRRVAAIVILFSVEVSGDATDHDLTALERVARACPVAKSLHPDLMQNLTFQFRRRQCVSATGICE